MGKITLLLACLCITIPVGAELQRVEVGGQLRMRARGNLNYQNERGAPARTLIPGGSILGRSVGPNGLASRFRFDDQGSDRYYVEMQTRLHVTARFSDDVLALIEFESADNWGEDFRSDYVTGADGRGTSTDDVEILQSYIEADTLFGYPLRLRAGRQTLKMGKGWLVGDLISGLLAFSFDALRLTYQVDGITIDAWWSKLTENFAGDEDVDFYGIYGTYTGYEPVSMSLYWLYVRDGRSLEQTTLSPLGESLEGFFGFDNYESTRLHTVGIRFWGGWGTFDVDWELAYQFGDAGQQGVGFGPAFGGYGDDSAEFDAFATDLEMGYTFDLHWQPRLYLGGAWYEGDDNRDSGILERLNPFREGKASVSFNRLFAHTSSKYSFILDGGQSLSNFQAVRLGVDLKPRDKVRLTFELEKFWVDEPFDRPVGPLGFWTTESDDDIGWQTSFIARYDFSEGLWFRVNWEHLFSGDAISDGNFSDRNGLLFLQGSDNDDADYIAAMVVLTF